LERKPVQYFKLNSKFLDEYKDKQPDFGPLGALVYQRTYSRVKEDGTQEKFWETAKRVVEGCFSIQKDHCKSLMVECDNDKAQKSAQEMYRRLFELKWLPPGRGLWMMGTESAERNGAALFNCAYISTVDIKTDLAEPFCWAMEMLLLGVGVGFGSEGSGTFTIKQPSRGDKVHQVADSREGWVAALRSILVPFTGKGFLPASFDFSLVREAGKPIKGFGGIASGPGPLKELLEDVERILLNRVGQKITTTDINDIMNLIGRTVVSGNVRRSAELSLGDPDDEEFLNLKNPDTNMERLMHHGWAANLSISAKRGMDYSKVAELAAKNGEPGLIWLDNLRSYGRMKDGINTSDLSIAGTNPCGEIGLFSFETCNLVELFPARHDSLEDLKVTIKYAYLYAKTVTLVKTHSTRTNAVIQRNRRIGCSMSGIAQSITKFGRAGFFDMCDKSYGYLKDLDKLYSDWMCIPRSIKLSTLKPSGSVSLLTGSTPGIHFPHSEYYIRRVRLQTTSPLVAVLSAHGYFVEEDKYSPNTVCVEFPVKEENFSRSKYDVSMWEQLEMAAQMQHYWSDNSVSITVTVRPEEKKDIKNALELYESRLKTVSFLPLEDHKYVQAPYQTITKEQYEEMVSKITPITSFTEDTHEVTERFCSNDTCTI